MRGNGYGKYSVLYSPDKFSVEFTPPDSSGGSDQQNAESNQVLDVLYRNGKRGTIITWDLGHRIVHFESYDVVFHPANQDIELRSKSTNCIKGQTLFSWEKLFTMDYSDIQYRGIDLTWWKSHKPLLEMIAAILDVEDEPAADQASDKVEIKVNGDRVVKENPVRRRKQKVAASFTNCEFGSTFPNLIHSLWTPPVPQVARPIMTIEKRIQQYLKSKGVSHAWSDSDGEHTLYLADCEIHFDVSKELITFENRETSRETTHGWTDWLRFNEAEIKSQGLSLKAWPDIRVIVMRVVQLLCGAYI